MTKKTIAKSFVELNSIKESNDDSVVSFAEPLAITDDSRQWNMTKYDISTLDIESYDGTVTADHGNKITDVIGKVINLRKNGNQVLIDGIKFAVKENPVAILAKNLMKGGFVTGVSIETIGGDPAPDGTWLNHSLCGLSVVAHPNNKNAYAVIANSIEEARQYGLRTNSLEELEESESSLVLNQKSEIISNEINESLDLSALKEKVRKLENSSYNKEKINSIYEDLLRVNEIQSKNSKKLSSIQEKLT